MVDSPAPRIRTRTPAPREDIPEPQMGRAGIQITFCASVDLSDRLLAEVRHRNSTKALSRDWTLERLIEAILRERFP